MSENNTTQNSGVGFLGLLTITFIVLKLTHVINWSWWWVLAPTWITFVVVFALFLAAGVVLWINNRS